MSMWVSPPAWHLQQQTKERRVTMPKEVNDYFLVAASGWLAWCMKQAFCPRKARSGLSSTASTRFVMNHP